MLRLLCSVDLAISSAAIAIGCAGLSVIVLWLTGIYFNARKKTRCTSCILICIWLLMLLTCKSIQMKNKINLSFSPRLVAASVAVWILLIAETLVLGYSVNRSIFNWPMWLAVGASGGYLMAFITMLISFCTTVCRQRKRGKNLYYTSNQY